MEETSSWKELMEGARLKGFFTRSRGEENGGWNSEGEGGKFPRKEFEGDCGEVIELLGKRE